MAVCAHCQKPADKGCDRCRAISYCCRACQVAHWKAQHRHECVPCVQWTVEHWQSSTARSSWRPERKTIVFEPDSYVVMDRKPVTLISEGNARVELIRNGSQRTIRVAPPELRLATPDEMALPCLGEHEPRHHDDKEDSDLEEHDAPVVTRKPVIFTAGQYCSIQRGKPPGMLLMKPGGTKVELIRNAAKKTVTLKQTMEHRFATPDEEERMRRGEHVSYDPNDHAAKHDDDDQEGSDLEDDDKEEGSDPTEHDAPAATTGWAQTLGWGFCTAPENEHAFRTMHAEGKIDPDQVYVFVDGKLEAQGATYEQVLLDTEQRLAEIGEHNGRHLIIEGRDAATMPPVRS